MRNDRLSVLETDGLTEKDALALEFGRGADSLREVRGGKTREA